MAIIKACSKSNIIKNTGFECNAAMLAPAMLIMVAPDVSWDDADLEDPITWMKTLIHERKAFPLFGHKAPVREVNNNAENDVMVKLDDGTDVFLRYGVYNRMLATTNGGLCFAKALQSFLNSGYSCLEVDATGQLLQRINSDLTYSGLITNFAYSPAPVAADLKNTPYKNRFQYSYSPSELVNNGVIFAGAEELLSMTGLIDVKFKSAAAASTTKLKISIGTECKGEDLIAKLGAALADVDLYVVTNKATGVAVTVSGAAIASGVMELTGTFVSAQTYTVTGSAPSVWLTNNVEGYDASLTGGGSIDILIP